MTVKPLSEEELVTAREYEDVGNTHSVSIYSAYKEQRLKELFAELKTKAGSFDDSGFNENEFVPDYVRWKDIEHLFEPLVRE